MEDYIGEIVLVTLRNPPDTQVRGLVSGIVDFQLCLRDVTWLPSQDRMEMYVVDGPGNLVDLEILSPVDHDTSFTTHVLPDVDPAILSYGKSSGKSLESKPSAAPQPVDVGVSNHLEDSKPQLAAPMATEVQAQSAAGQHPGDTSATLTGPFQDLSLNGFSNLGQVLNGHAKGQQLAEAQIEWKKRRRGKGRSAKDRRADVAGQISQGANAIQEKPEQPPLTNGKQKKKPKDDGWRKTPLLEEVSRPKAQLLHPQDVSGPKGLSRRQQKQLQRSKMEQSGWATEDATDIQEMGDFDFSGNLSKFDKRGVFDQLKQEDTTADEARLVSHNRLPPRPGTAGGKNLHYTENVLSSPKPDSRGAWSSGDSEADGSQARLSSGRSSRRAMSRVSIKNPPSRKGSAIVTDQHMTGSGSLPESKAKTRLASRKSSTNMKAQRDLSSSRDTEVTAMPTPIPSRPSFQIVSSDMFCPCLTPLQMLELEQLAIGELRMTEELMTENASRCIAETACKLVSIGESNGKNASRPVIVVMAGNTKSGARAIAGARQLINHCVTVIVALLAGERQADFLDVVQRQLYLYEKCGGDVIQPDQVTGDSALMKLHANPELVIDAMLGMHMSFDDLETYDQERYVGLVKWAKGSARVMSIDVPSGLDASSGSATALDRADLLIPCEVVLSLGAPKTGLLTAMSKSGRLSRLEVLVADIGIGNQVWRKFGARSKHGIAFGLEWVARLRYQAGLE